MRRGEEGGGRETERKKERKEERETERKREREREREESCAKAKSIDHGLFSGTSAEREKGLNYSTGNMTEAFLSSPFSERRGEEARGGKRRVALGVRAGGAHRHFGMGGRPTRVGGGGGFAYSHSLEDVGRVRDVYSHQ